jgi:hypothetical protein
MALSDDLTPPAPPLGGGEMGGGWKATVTLTWIGVVIGLASVWAVSRQVGLSTWWLGPPANGRHLALNLAPFIAPFFALVLAIGGSHRTWTVGVLAGAVIMLIGAVDLGRVTRLGVIEIVLGLAGAGSSLASWVGTPRATSP